MELLSPAGDWDALKAGVAAGADAVYLGGKLFSARQNAVNFDLDDLARAADYLHLRGRKMYVTVNTLIKTGELDEAMGLLSHLYRIGTDAVIIQDLGLLSLAKTAWPDWEFHASTQMTIYDAAGVRFLKKLGIKRVVLAREVSLAEMEEIIGETGMEVEVFVHGALCVSYSGACLFSSLIGGRSGNRGHCAQPCRLEYSLLQDGRKVEIPGVHLLSPKDLCLLPYLRELAAAGVRALKIEGRMKGPEYVGTVVRIYRGALDRLAADPGVYAPLPEEMKTLESVFNRGLTSGYLRGDLGPELISVNRPSNRGFFVGRVKSYDYKSRRVSVLLEEDLAAGDGVEVWVSRGGRTGTIVEDLRVSGKKVEAAFAGTEASFSMPQSARPGDRVFLTSSRSLEAEIRRMLRNDYPGSRLACKMKAAVAPGKPLTITLADYEGNSVTVSSAETAGPARKRPLTEEVLAEHLSRLGDSPFIIHEFSAEITGEPMLPFGIIHEARREAVAALARRRLDQYLRPPSEPGGYKKFLRRENGPGRSGPSYLTVYAGSLKIVREAIAAGCRKIIVGGESLRNGFQWNEGNLRRALDLCRAAGAVAVIALPGITRQREKSYLRSYLASARNIKPDGLLVSFAGGLETALAETDLPLYINYPLHTFNLFTGSLFKGLKVKGITLSPELSRRELGEFFSDTELSGLELEVLVFGALELMISQFCPIGALVGRAAPRKCPRPCHQYNFQLRDRKGFVFPVVTDEFCRMHLLNSRDLSLIRELPDLKEKNLSLRLDLRYHSDDIALRIIRLYQEAMDSGGREDLWDRLEAAAGRGLTRGHYHRGVE